MHAFDPRIARQARAADPAQAAAEDREHTSDRLVQLMGAYLRERIDWEAPRWAPLLEWMAAEARAAMTPAERVALAEEAAAFARRLMAESRSRDSAAPHATPPDAR